MQSSEPFLTGISGCPFPSFHEPMPPSIQPSSFLASSFSSNSPSLLFILPYFYSDTIHLSIHSFFLLSSPSLSSTQILSLLPFPHLHTAHHPSVHPSILSSHHSSPGTSTEVRLLSGSQGAPGPAQEDDAYRDQRKAVGWKYEPLHP